MIADLLRFAKPEAEASALFLLMGKDLHTWIMRLSETMFYAQDHKSLFREIAKQYQARKTFDFGDLPEAEKTIALKIFESAGSTAKMEHYFSTLAHARDVRAVPCAVQSTMQDPDEPDCVQNLKSEILKLGCDGIEMPMHLRELGARAAVRWEERLTSDAKVYHLGIPVVDDDVQLRAGNTVYVVAPPKSGKTWILVNMACHLATRSKVLFVSAEMHPDELYTRFCGKIAGVNFSALEYRSGCNDLLAQWSEKIDDINQRKLWALKARGITLGGLVSVCMEAVHTGFEVIIIDYIQRIVHQAESQRVATMEISREISNIAGRHEILMISASQANRLARTAEKTQAFHAKESAAVEEDADAILSLTLKTREAGEKAMVVDVVQRNGACFDATLNFDPTTGRLWQ